MRRLVTRRLPLLLALLLAALAAPLSAGAGSAQQARRTYQNPLAITIPGGGKVESCADPSIIRGQKPGDNAWYMYCTTDPLNDEDKTGDNFNFRLIPILKSPDLVSWTYLGDAFSAKPSWVDANAGLWAPDIEYFNGQYYLYYTASNTSLPGGGSAIGVAISSSPAGPWVDSGAPAVEPHEAYCCPGSRRWTYDADVLEANGQKYIYYGSYFGGISVRKLSNDGLSSDPASAVLVALDNRYEGGTVFKRGQYYYLFASATDCCRGALTGYSVFAGRSTSPTGPFVDREGVSLLAGRVGGSPVISMNGNRWVGPGHNAVFADLAGQTWFLYHAVDRFEPYFAGALGFTKRPVLMDPLDWADGWPTVRGGFWASDGPMAAPAGRNGDKGSYKPIFAQADRPGAAVAALSDEFAGASLGGQWSWVRQPEPAAYGVEGGQLRFETQDADLFRDPDHGGRNNASVLTEPAPSGNYMVEAKLDLNLPDEGCCFNYVQAGLVIYGDDDNFVKLAHASIWNTRQTEFAKEYVDTEQGPFYGNTVVGPPNGTTWLRIVKRTVGGEEHYRAYTSRDGTTWVRGGVWTHALGANTKIGLIALGGSGFTARFDYVRVYSLQ